MVIIEPKFLILKRVDFAFQHNFEDLTIGCINIFFAKK